MQRFLESNAKRSQSFCGHDFNNQQADTAARKLRASTRSPGKTSSHMLSRTSLAARFKQWIGSRNMHFPSIRLYPSYVAEPVSGKSLCGLLCERQTHCLEKLARNPHENFANRGQRNRVSASLCARKSAQVPRKCGPRAQSRATEYGTTPM